MSAHNFKPGDVALVEAGCWASRRVALRLAEGWAHVNGVNVDDDGIVSPIRPLVVIDPEDREQVERLRDLLPADWGLTEDTETRQETFAAVQTALRESANPTPERFADVILFKPSGKYYTEEPWRIPPGAIGPYDMERSPDFRRIGGGAVLIDSQEPWGYPHLFPGVTQ